MKDFLRQNGILLLVIALLLSILIGVTSAFLGGQADPLSNVVNVIISPIRGGVSAAADWMEGVYTYVFRYQELEQELTELRGQVGELEDELRQKEEAIRENEQLRELLNLQARRRDFTFEDVRITGRSTSNWESTLTLNKGSSSGIEAGDCVVTETGVLVGVVAETGTNWSTVSTIINTETQMGGIVNRTYSAGVLEGDFALMNQGRLKMNYLPEGAQLVSGDEVLTSGRGEIFPSGLVVGTVEGVFTDPSGQTRYAVVKPAVDLDVLIKVFVIKDFEIIE
ncbi:rod shape-determining protein MreC [Pseudoflavonifractor sp. 60]|uniref:rod shape-determining protein MreC n=1 Tax=Pseudoflavonifractor sp. 60 TaxID=2304576 RepID=UPI00136B4636|nr:rod shape-determining protein MreC [Pseudoflavonifractor sp. 60]